MPLVLDSDRALLSGLCGVETAEPLLAWLCEEGHNTVDLTGCKHLHGAVLQVLLAARPALVGEPETPFLREYVMPLLGPGEDDTG